MKEVLRLFDSENNYSSDIYTIPLHVAVWKNEKPNIVWRLLGVDTLLQPKVQTLNFYPEF